MSPQEFIAKWQSVTLSERSACQQHFLDLCELLNQPKPAAADPDGAFYTFERGVSKTDGGNGWADVWMRGHFGWEYKGKHKDLVKAYDQLLKYREALENPPLLVVCDLDRFEIHTNFTGTVKTVYAFDLQGLADPKNLDVLRKLFTTPQQLKPTETPTEITQRAASQFAELADGMRARGIEPHRAAQFLMKLMFCMFAEDVRLLPDELFSKLLANCKGEPARLTRFLKSLFEQMASGGFFGTNDIPYFNGGLFKDADVIDLTPAEIRILQKVNIFDWSNVEPSVFGTMFERTLDPAKRSQIGAHYTSREDIETLLEPVMMAPLRREWADVKTQCEALFEKVREQSRKSAKAGRIQRTESKAFKDLTALVRDFLDRLSKVRVLDPACGSGNFLYVALHLLLDLEKEVIGYVGSLGLGLFPQVRPTQLSGIEINPYAQELAQVVIWIGFLQWMHHNGFQPPRDPVLDPIESIQCKDAILDLTNPDCPTEPEWPAVDFIVGNPPFLGSSVFPEKGIPREYVDAMKAVFQLPGKSDLCCYWFDRALREIEQGRAKRCGLLATQSIRHGGSREVLDAISTRGRIFFGESDRAWILDGASVRVAMVGFESASESGPCLLDGQVKLAINADLTAGMSSINAVTLKENRGKVFEGDQKGGDFDIDDSLAMSLLHEPNPHGRPNSDVITPRINANDLVKVRPEPNWIIDFGNDCSLEAASQYEAPFRHIQQHVAQSRQGHSEKRSEARWWIHKRPRPEMRNALAGLKRFIVTPRVGKHRLFAWLSAPTLPDSRLFVFTSDDEALWGMLHSRAHEFWSLRQGARHGVGDDPTYNNRVCFETFPFPKPSASQREAIANAVSELDRLRTNWLNPPEWTREEVLEFPGSVDGPWARYVSNPNLLGIGTVRYPRLVPKDEACAKKLAKRTLTNLYNERPTWLDLAHKRLDAAVFAAYGWSPDISDDDLLAKLLELNLERAAAEGRSA